MFLLSFFKKEEKPYDEGFLDVGHGHEIYYMQLGNPKGKPVIKFHGGPGGAANLAHAQSFDLKKYRVILFSQRGCGQSHFKDLLLENTTINSVDDAFSLLTHLNIKEKVIVAGGSFGSTLALLFAEKYPKKIKALILNAIFLARKRDIDWVNVESVRFYPDLMAQMQQKAGPKKLVDFFHQKIFSEKYKDIQLALQYYGSYEYYLGKLNPDFSKVPPVTDKAVNMLRIYLEYTKKRMFLKENEILEKSYLIKHIPTLIVHNRLDFCCPVEEAYLLKKALPKARLIINSDIGHSSLKLKKRLVKETNSFLKNLE